VCEHASVNGDRGDAHADSELARIRGYYAVRDRPRSRSGTMERAAGLLAKERCAIVRELVTREIGPRARILDVGCGSGSDLRWWLDAGWPAEQLAGCDMLPNRVAVAQELCPDVEIRLADGRSLPFHDDVFDVVTAATVFSSILDPGLRRSIFGEMERLVRGGGVIAIYDFRVRKPTNPHVIAMTPRRLGALGRTPDASMPVSPLIYGVAAAARLGERGERAAMRLMPRTHLLSVWRSPRADQTAGQAS